MADEITRLKAYWHEQIAARDKGTTHWQDCWTNHPRCAIFLLTQAHDRQAADLLRLQAERDRAEQQIAQLESLDELRRSSNAHVMKGLRRIAKALQDDEPQDLGAVDILASLVEFVVKEREAAEAALVTLHHELPEKCADHPHAEHEWICLACANQGEINTDADEGRERELQNAYEAGRMEGYSQGRADEGQGR